MVLLFIFCCFNGFSQKVAPGSLRAQTFQLKAKSVAPESLKLPFEAIEIIDNRYDTSIVGFAVDKLVSILGEKAFYRIKLKPDVPTGIESFYNDYFRSSFTPNGKTLLISIKRLWIDDLPSRNNSRLQKNFERASQQDIYATFDFYFGSGDAYFPLLRVDTVFQRPAQTRVVEYDREKEAALPFFCFALEKMVENANFCSYMNDGNSRRKMSRADIGKYNARIKDIPILRDSVQKGVFLTLDEFRNNRPSVTSFSRKKVVKTKLFEVVDKHGRTIRNYFACYDGEVLRIGKPLSALTKNLPQNHDILYRVGDSFQYYEYDIRNYESYGFVSGVNSYLGDVPFRFPSRSIVIIPRQLDLD